METVEFDFDEFNDSDEVMAVDAFMTEYGPEPATVHGEPGYACYYIYSEGSAQAVVDYVIARHHMR